MKEHEIDHSRNERLGFPEIVYGEFKTVTQLKAIVLEYEKKGNNLLVTRLQGKKASELLMLHSNAIYDDLARTLTIQYSEPKESEGIVGVISGGT